jgi:hypothetical protein
VDGLDAIAEELNSRPRAVLADRTPNQVMRRLGHHIERREIRNVQEKLPLVQGTRTDHSCISSSTLSVIREIVSLLTDAPEISAKCAEISPLVRPFAYSDNTTSSTPESLRCRLSTI